MEKELQTELEWKFFNGREVKLQDNLSIKPYTIGEIMDNIGVVNYFQIMSILALSKKQLVEREDWKVIEELNLFDVVVSDESLIGMYSLLFEVAFRSPNNVYYQKDLKAFIIQNPNGTLGHIYRGTFDTIIEILRFGYCVEESKRDSEREDIDDELASLLAEFEAEKEKIDNAKGTNTNIDYNSIMEGLVCKVSSLKITDIQNLTIYQMLRLYNRSTHNDVSNNVFRGVYSGCIDAKEIDLAQYGSCVVLPH